MINRSFTYQDFFVLGVQPRKKGIGVEKKCFTYTYDALNRITSAVDNTGNYNLTSVAYDKNGNITALNRKGHINTGATLFGNMDLLNYEYETNSNKLKKVTDTSGKVQGFNDGVNQATEYTYDVNGNMLRDYNKGITSDITYNYLNLPMEIRFNNSNTKKINYTYDATGIKLRKVVNDGGALTTLDYAANGAVYENNTLQFIPHAEGYITPSGSSWRYVYQYRDHIDNIRLSYSDGDGNGTISQSEIIQENNYQPFGLKMRGFNNNTNSLGNSMAERYMFGGKEFDDSFNETLNTYDFGARNYDPALGRWMNIDPLAEQMRRHSPYNYAFDNPIYFIDPDGMAPVGCCGDLYNSGFYAFLRKTDKFIDKSVKAVKEFFTDENPEKPNIWGDSPAKNIDSSTKDGKPLDIDAPTIKEEMDKITRENEREENNNTNSNETSSSTTETTDASIETTNTSGEVSTDSTTFKVLKSSINPEFAKFKDSQGKLNPLYIIDVNAKDTIIANNQAVNAVNHVQKQNEKIEKQRDSIIQANN